MLLLILAIICFRRESFFKWNIFWCDNILRTQNHF